MAAPTRLLIPVIATTGSLFRDWCAGRPHLSDPYGSPEV